MVEQGIRSSWPFSSSLRSFLTAPYLTFIRLLFSASSWETGAPQGSVLGPLFSDFIHPAQWSVYLQLRFLIITFFRWLQVWLFSPDRLFDIRFSIDCLLDIFFSTLSVPMLCVVFPFFFPYLAFFETISPSLGLQGSAFSRWNLHQSCTLARSGLIVPFLLTPTSATSADFS